MNIYQAQPQDVDTILPLYLAYRRFYQVEENLGQAREFILKRLQLNESVIFFAEVDGKAVGFTQLYPLFCSLEMKRIWLLYDLYVDESARQHGVAQQLIARAEQLAKESDSAFIMLSTATDNTKAQALYERSGFVRDTDFYVYNKMLK
ncbi:GNAT family N-acetyltransferase [Klebsiella aerogenes]|jgi:ribosomal protein S18 acetylase RimI-like enzyme|uniref:Putative N-acetyltransferase n=1 Tax=Klebsiella aerogenes (strain ATCC 13048 / DSM 30053 / CCUG 1429 / JCM 1235 / KCTC 2190 / NBRC 13534 / NCIMB 10102 / NCTC 10006 / CDC 819-56) TaxID=1028307 RepID=A0A0H3FWS6_KLEAK|nr:GNAT family N-acetyltransferase [Klebsiella aerogenes]AEG99031.1 putative N-acetyltransferase [Klebsiella aerogenes KCTC 2190]EIV2481767.1 GNAT family N-acetyltransferase [Klebsiella aerogenes]EIV5803500.1 GNAT family N-acetyltransferase [Klebsiella aerogenes]EIV6180610.1 GNAT family N-acetyltransferase [Klebsiella aerogenes]EIV6705233.1 GNAT family N-acetyltransferase [Klebsiella aerogenes]